MSVMETSELYKTGTELKLSLQQRYKQEAALPENRNDPHFGDRFMAEVGPQLDQWGSGAGTEHGKMLAATLKSNIRSELFNHVASGQAAMDAAHVLDNLDQTLNRLGSGLMLDPSAANLSRTIGAARDAIQGMTMSIPDVARREQVASSLLAERLPQLVIARYNGVAESIKQQVAESGDESKAPAYGQMGDDIAKQVGFEYLPPEVQAKLATARDQAVEHGKELYKSRIDTAKSQATEQGKAAFAEIHNVVTSLALAGQGPTPEVVDAIHRFSRTFGATNPGEVSALDDYLIRTQKMAQDDQVQSYSPQVRNDIRTGMSLPSTDPRRPTLASITRAYSAGQITTEDWKSYSEILGKLDKPETDPGFKPAWENFKRWQGLMAQSIGQKGFPGTEAARAQFLHDSTNHFMGWGHAHGWSAALDHLTNAQKGEFNKMIPAYSKAAMQTDPAKWFQQHWSNFSENGDIIPAHGSHANPVYPAANAPAQPVKVDQKAVNDILGGH